MGSQLHQALKNLCFNTEWKYAVFWKLKHRARMMLTWEDAYHNSHDQHDPSGSKWFSESMGNLRDGCYSHDPLGLAVAKMSCRVYSLGEGIVGLVAVTGKHMWISPDKQATKSCSSFECIDEWQTQFLAGIRTIVFVAVIPHGVVQLGSLNKIAEDLTVVKHIRESLLGFQDSLMECTSVALCSRESSACLLDKSTRDTELEMFQYSMHNLDSLKDPTDVWSPTFTSLGRVGNCSRKTMEVRRTHGAAKRANLIRTKFDTSYMEQPKTLLRQLVSESCEADNSEFRGVHSEDNIVTSSTNSFNNKTSINNVTLLAVKSGVDIAYFPSADGLNSTGCNSPDGDLCVQELSGGPIQKESEKNFDVQSEFNQDDMQNASFRFSAGNELFEALGPAFQKQNSCLDWYAKRTETETSIQVPEGTDCCSLLTTNSGSEDLLEAVVANVCCSGGEIKKSICKSVKPLLASEKILEPITNNACMNSTSCPYAQSSLTEKAALHCLTSSGISGASFNSVGQCVASFNSSRASGVRSSRGFSSTSPITCSEQSERPREPGKVSKKRAKPGENCRPRPRDRQLIQDRIKELRELVPNGSKCSIDSLLERTIKHVLFMQSITKHADKLNNCGELKLLEKGTGVGGSFNREQGSSWAVEVGSHLKVCPIIVENIDMNGQMLVQMLCEDCCHFLEIAEAIRSLGLTILKGVTEAFDDKTWLSFVVEGLNNRNMHRMDILWSLVQILQPGTGT